MSHSVGESALLSSNLVTSAVVNGAHSSKGDHLESLCQLLPESRRNAVSACMKIQLCRRTAMARSPGAPRMIIRSLLPPPPPLLLAATAVASVRRAGLSEADTARCDDASGVLDTASMLTLSKIAKGKIRPRRRRSSARFQSGRISRQVRRASATFDDLGEHGQNVACCS